jgi:hypothetical protein
LTSFSKEKRINIANCNKLLNGEKTFTDGDNHPGTQTKTSGTNHFLKIELPSADGVGLSPQNDEDKTKESLPGGENHQH